MTPKIFNPTVALNADWRENFHISIKTDGSDYPIVSASLKMQIRSTQDSDDVVFELSTDNARLAITNGSQGRFSIVVPIADMSAISPGNYVHDLVMTLNGESPKLFYGNIRFGRGVTQ